jgi:beta-glucosidase/6-phospho-beta-glucosidase/beta-galactosidase
MAEHNELNRIPRRLLDVYLQMQHYTQWKEDLDRAADLGVKAVRYSVPWYKANPQPGVYDWEWISKPLEYMVNKLDIIPVIDLVHYGTPLWIDNGVLNHAYPQHISAYGSAFARQFKGLVDHFTPHNEPQLSAFLCGLHHYWPPYLTGIDGWLKVGINVARGMVLTSQVLRAELADPVLISAECFASPTIQDVASTFKIEVSPTTQEDFDYLVNTFPACLAYGKVSPSAPFGKVLSSTGMSESDLDWFNTNAQLPTVLGVNLYPDCYHRSSDPQEGLRLGAEELACQLTRACRFFGRPVYLTETSDGETVEQKTKWMEKAVEVIEGLKESGIPVVGMNWWPLYETIQWDYRDTTRTVVESIRPGGWNNGLYKIKEQFDGTLQRVSTGAVESYREIIHANPFMDVRR